MAVKEGKFAGPIAIGQVGISQTYHGDLEAKPNDLTRQCAIDILIARNRPFYSVCYGKVIKMIASKGSYLVIQPEGSTMYVLYVHTTGWLVKVGDKVKPGQKLGVIGKENHLHLALANISGKQPHPQIMNYFDRNVRFSTPYASIRAAWFKGTNIDWSKFKDLTYKVIPPTLPDNKPPVDNCEDNLKKVRAEFQTAQDRWELEKGAIEEQHNTELTNLENTHKSEKLELVTTHLRELQAKTDVIEAKEQERAKYQRLYQQQLDFSKLSLLEKINLVVQDIKESFRANRPPIS